MRISDWSSDVFSSDLPCGEAREQLVENRARRAPGHIVRAVAIDRVLADVEIERRQIHRAEIVELGKQRVKVVFGAAAPHQRVELRQPVEDEAFQLQHLSGRQALGVVEPGEVAEQRSEEHTSELQSLMRTSYAV